MHVSTENMSKHVLCGQDSDEGVVWGPLDHMTHKFCVKAMVLLNDLCSAERRHHKQTWLVSKSKAIQSFQRDYHSLPDSVLTFICHHVLKFKMLAFG